jgi:hypothetical protein
MLAETFAEQTPGAAACDCAAYAFARDDAQFRFRAVGQLMPVGDKTAEREALALLSYARKFTALLKPRGATQSQTIRRFGGHERAS